MVTVTVPITPADAEQSTWLDGMTRETVMSGRLHQYIAQERVAGALVNPAGWRAAIETGTAYDAAIRAAFDQGATVEEIVVDLILEDAIWAADLFRPMYDRAHGGSGWVSLELSPALAHDAGKLLATIKEFHARLGRPNVLIGVPGTRPGMSAAEEAIFAGVPVNLGLLFSADHYVAAADAFLRGVERRLAAGLSPNVAVVASVVVHRWGTVRANSYARPLREQLALAIAKRTYKAHCGLLNSPRWQRAGASGFRPQRLVWASGPEKNSATLALAPGTVNVLTEERLAAIADDGLTGYPLPADGGDCDEVLARSAQAGLDVHRLAGGFQEERIRGLGKSWRDLLVLIASKGGIRRFGG